MSSNRLFLTKTPTGRISKYYMHVCVFQPHWEAAEYHVKKATLCPSAAWCHVSSDCIVQHAANRWVFRCLQLEGFAQHFCASMTELTQRSIKRVRCFQGCTESLMSAEQSSCCTGSEYRYARILGILLECRLLHGGSRMLFHGLDAQKLQTSHLAVKQNFALGCQMVEKESGPWLPWTCSGKPQGVIYLIPLSEAG